jgi:hypothetical protein
MRLLWSRIICGYNTSKTEAELISISDEYEWCFEISHDIYLDDMIRCALYIANDVVEQFECRSDFDGIEGLRLAYEHDVIGKRIIFSIYVDDIEMISDILVRHYKPHQIPDRVRALYGISDSILAVSELTWGMSSKSI